jgi:hypothetical protein
MFFILPFLKHSGFNIDLKDKICPKIVHEDSERE